MGWEDPLEKEKTTHSSILAWRIPWTVWCMGCKESDMTERLSLTHLKERVNQIWKAWKLFSGSMEYMTDE